MNRFCYPKRSLLTSLKKFILPLLCVTCAFGCSSTRYVQCDNETSYLYHVTLKNSNGSSSESKSVESFFRPTTQIADSDKTKVILIDCTNAENYDIEDRAKFMHENLMVVDASEIERISTSSDADVAPQALFVSDLSSNNTCDRNRAKFKTEIRGLLSYRMSSSEGINYPSPNGDVFYDSGVSNAGIGGTTFYYGAELALLPQVFTFGLGDNHSFNLGLLTGIWPVDGGLYIPLAVHPRLTLNNTASPFGGSCSTWYLFGDVGTAYDASGDVSFINSNSNFVSSWFTGLGVGRDFFFVKKADLSIDFGYRYTSLGLPPNQSLEECLAEQGQAYSSYMNRNVGQLFIRVGFTW